MSWNDWGSSTDWGSSSGQNNNQQQEFGQWGLEAEAAAKTQTNDFKPAVKILKRETSTVDEKKRETVVKEDFKTREEKYLKAREKIFGTTGNSSTGSTQGHNQSTKSTPSPKPKKKILKP